MARSEEGAIATVTEDAAAEIVEVDAPPITGSTILGRKLVGVIALGVFAGGRALIEYHRQQRAAGEAAEPAVEVSEAREVMTVDEAAEFLGLDRNTVYDACGRSEIPHRRVGKRILLSRSRLVAWLGACKAAPVGNG